jgi:1-acyl-sn-glycerol-3-phosphate acyltransferase
MHWRGIFELTPGKSRVVYMNEIPVDGYTVKDVEIFKRRVYQKMEDGLSRYQQFKTKGISVKDMAGENE